MSVPSSMRHRIAANEQVVVATQATLSTLSFLPSHILHLQILLLLLHTCQLSFLLLPA